MAKQEHDERYERWLLRIAEHLRAQGLSCFLGYDDRHLGNHLYLAIPGDKGYSELVLLRGTRDKATAILLCEEPDAARALAQALGGVHRSINRVRNARRRFSHLVERMAARLAQSFDRKAESYPQEALARLRQIIPDARPMIGTAAHRHIKSRARADEVQYGASISVMSAGALAGNLAELPPRRALRYNPERRVFEAYGYALRAVQELARSHGDVSGIVVPGAVTALTAELAAAAEKPQGDQSSDPSLADAAEFGLDVASDACDCSSLVPDIGGCDLPDCDTCDVPDCSFDCSL